MLLKLLNVVKRTEENKKSALRYFSLSHFPKKDRISEDRKFCENKEETIGKPELKSKSNKKMETKIKNYATADIQQHRRTAYLHTSIRAYLHTCILAYVRT